MKREINQEFEFNGKKFKVIEADLIFPYKCPWCGFYDSAKCNCTGTLGVTGDCRMRWRGDRKEVIFVEL